MFSMLLLDLPSMANLILAVINLLENRQLPLTPLIGKAEVGNFPPMEKATLSKSPNGNGERRQPPLTRKVVIGNSPNKKMWK